jgi:SAM-dependent methyltransferase
MTQPANTREAYDSVASTYADKIFGELTGKPFDRHLLNRLAESVEGRGVVCDIGCGPGHVAKYLRERGAEVIGVDLSAGMVAEAARLNPGIAFSVGDMRALDAPDGAWAAIVALYSIIHLEPADVPVALAEFRRVLIPGGLLLLSFHAGDEVRHLDEWWGVPVSIDFHFLSPDWVLNRLREAGFDVLEQTVRAPIPGVEAATQRCYMLASAPVAR